MSQTNKFPPKKRRLGLSELTLIGLFVGIGCGLFFGEGCARFQILGDAFVGLLQMTVLPYIVLSLVGGIGKLNLEQSKRLAGKALLSTAAAMGDRYCDSSSDTTGVSQASIGLILQYQSHRSP